MVSRKPDFANITIDGYRSQLIAFASEFLPNEDGEPDTCNVHANIRRLKSYTKQLELLLSEVLKNKDTAPEELLTSSLLVRISDCLKQDPLPCTLY
jgi:hypothetical protein